MMNPNPKCQSEDCRFNYGSGMTTDAYYSPVYDKYGNNLNPDGNTTSGYVACSTCDKRWDYSTQYGKTIFKEIENG